MLRQTLLVLATSLLFSSLIAQQYRSIDGQGNNLQNPEWGMADGDIMRVTTVGYRDGIFRAGGLNRPNPRIISNELFAQDSLLSDPLNLSDYTWVFGQFIDHDITLVPNNPTENAAIPISFPDPFMNPSGRITVFIPMTRSLERSGTGTSTSNPREYINHITAFVDGSGVYGSDSIRAAYLRSFVDGKLRTSSGNLMPFNTLTGELEDEVDPNAPGMDNENPFATKWFIAGDVRANENPLLTSLHILFVREHNRLCDELIQQYPNWTDEQLYQHARKIVGGLIQKITFDDWLPMMGVHLSPYAGYDANVNPAITNVFSAAAFRLGHTLLNSNILRVSNDGQTLPEGNMRLKDAFFNPLSIVEVGGVDPFFKGMAIQVEQDLDSKVVDDVRNFLFGPPGSNLGGLDLAAININRGRERGLPDFNTVRADFGLAPYSVCSQICPDSTVYNKLEELYGDIEEIDPWVGMLAETHMSDALFGETIMEIMLQQFGSIRDGDRFYYENDPDLSEAEKNSIRNTNLRKVIMRNTGIMIMQENVFSAMDHSDVCPLPITSAIIEGSIRTEDGAEVNEVGLQLMEDGSASAITQTNEDGEFNFIDLPACRAYRIDPSKNEDPANGLSTFDLLLAARHILGVSRLESPYQIIAADINRSGSVSTFDLVEMRKMLLSITSEYPNNTSWRFVDQAFTFTDPLNPFLDTFPEYVEVPFLDDSLQYAFVAIKVGDLNGSAETQLMGTTTDRNNYAETLRFFVEDQEIKSHQQFRVDFRADDLANIEGYQFALKYDTDLVEYVSWESAALPQLDQTNFGFHQEEGLIKTSWNGQTATAADEVLFSFIFKAKSGGQLSELINLDQGGLSPEAYDSDLNVINVVLEFGKAVEDQFQVHQNQPNPFIAQTNIGIQLPGASDVRFRLMDPAGKEVLQMEQHFEAGYHNLTVQKAELPASGVYYYQIETDFGTVSKRMMLVE